MLVAWSIRRSACGSYLIHFRVEYNVLSVSISIGLVFWLSLNGISLNGSIFWLNSDVCLWVMAFH